jgi:hypothetical protein
MQTRTLWILVASLALVLVAAFAWHEAYDNRPAVLLPAHAPQPAASARARVAVVVMENEEGTNIIGSSEAPYINKLAKEGAVATNFYAVMHPSLPNYLAMIGGSNFGVTSDCTDCSATGPNLGTQLSAAGISWKAYAEDYPGNCSSEASDDNYAKRHVPFLYFPSITQNAALCAHVVGFDQLDVDMKSGNLPSFTWITPNLCDDMHNCGVAAGDKFMSQLAPPLLDALGSRGILVVTWDEGQTNAACCGDPGGGHTTLIMVGPGVKAGATTGVAYDHYSVLRFFESRFGLAPLGKAADRRPAALSELLK